MKTILAAALLSANLLATTFNFKAPQDYVVQSDTPYALAPNFAVEIKSVEAGYEEGVAQIVVNGQEKKYPVKVVDIVDHGSETIKTFEATVAHDVLARGFCDEYESFRYIVTFKEADEYGHYSYIHRVGVKVERAYSYDRCHSGMQYETYVYKRIQ